MDVVVSIAWETWPFWFDRGGSVGRTFDTTAVPNVETGDRVYVVSGGIVRGWTTLRHLERTNVRGRWTTQLVCEGEHHAVTPYCWYPDRCECPWVWNGPHPMYVRARMFGYRSWDRADEVTFPSWQTYDWQRRTSQDARRRP